MPSGRSNSDLNIVSRLGNRLGRKDCEERPHLHFKCTKSLLVMEHGSSSSRPLGPESPGYYNAVRDRNFNLAFDIFNAMHLWTATWIFRSVLLLHRNLIHVTFVGCEVHKCVPLGTQRALSSKTFSIVWLNLYESSIGKAIDHCIPVWDLEDSCLRGKCEPRTLI